MEVVMVIVAIFVFIKILLPTLLAILHVFLWPFTALLRLFWEFKWIFLAGIAVLLLLSALGAFA